MPEVFLRYIFGFAVNSCNNGDLHILHIFHMHKIMWENFSIKKYNMQ